MRALAKATGRSLATAYNYFSSKEEILFALQKEAFETLIGAADQALEDVESASSRLYVFILNHVNYCTAHADVMRVLIHEAGSLPPAKRRQIRELKTAYFRIGQGVISGVLEEGCGQIGAAKRSPNQPAEEAEIERITYSLFGMLNWLYSWYEPERHGDASELAHSMRHLILCGAVVSCPAIGVVAGADQTLEGSLKTPPLLGGRAATKGGAS